MKVTTGPLFTYSSAKIDFVGRTLRDETTRKELNSLLQPLAAGRPGAGAAR